MSPLSESFEFIIGLPDIDSLTLKFKDTTEQLKNIGRVCDNLRKSQEKVEDSSYKSVLYNAKTSIK